MPSKLTTTLLLLLLGTLSTSLPTATDPCAIPSWHIDSLNVTYSNVTDIPGTASFALSNTVTNNTESLSCPLTFNSLCQILGTPNDRTLQVVMQVNIDAAYVTLNQSWVCEGLGIDTFVIGTGTVNIECPVWADDMTCYGPADGTGVINGTIVVEDVQE